MTEKSPTPKNKKIKKWGFKKFLTVAGLIIGLIFVCLAFYSARQSEISFFPFKFFKKDGASGDPSGLPKTPTGRVAPPPEFFEKIKEEQGKTPSGEEFKGPAASPPSNFDSKKPPTAGDLKITPSFCSQHCASCPYPLNPAASWKFNDPGDSQSAFQIQVAENNSFKNPVDSGKIKSSQEQCGIPDGCELPAPLAFNKKYWLRIKVWDSLDIESGWTTYSGFYQTPIHMYPAVYFEWSPKTPQIGKEIQFTDFSKAYGGSDGKTEIEKAIRSREWDFQNGEPPRSSEQNPKIIFEKTPGEKKVTLAVTDKDGLQCGISKNISVILPLPKYQEGF